MDKIAKALWNFIEKIAHGVLGAVFHVIGRELPDEVFASFMQFVKFGIVGASNTLISYLTYVIGISVGLYYLAASILGFVVSVIHSFYWNNKYVFAADDTTQRNLWKSFCRTFVAYAGTGLVLNNILLYFQVNVLGWSKVIAPLVNLLITIPLNFLLNKLWAFRNK